MPQCQTAQAQAVALHAVGWLFTPAWWLGVASGLTVGRDRQCFLRQRRGLKQGQRAAWVANCIMTLVSILVVVLVCAIYFGRTGPAQTDSSYLVLSGREDAYPNLNDQTNLRKVAEALHAALGLGSSYPTANIRIWLAAEKTVAGPQLVRHLLLDAPSSKVVVLGYTLAKVTGLPEASVLATLVLDTATTQALAQHLTAAAFLAPQFATLVSIGFVPPAVNTPEQAILQLTGGDASQSFLAPIGALLQDAPPAPGPGPYFLLIKGEHDSVPALNDTTVLAKVSQALHEVFDLSADYPASNIQVSLNKTDTLEDRRKLLVWSPLHLIVLEYAFRFAAGLPEAAVLEAVMNDTTKNQVLADTLARLDFLSGQHANEDRVYIGFTTTRNATAAALDLYDLDTYIQGPAFDMLRAISKLDCVVSNWANGTCNATAPGGNGYKTDHPCVETEPKNGGTPCPEPITTACTAAPGCDGLPPRWLENTLLVDSWSCSGVDGVYWDQANCIGTCTNKSDSGAGETVARCNNTTWHMSGNAFCSPSANTTAATEMEFDPASMLPSGQLNASVWSQAAFTGFYVHNKTNTTGPLAGQLMCNRMSGSYDLIPASTIKGDMSLVLIPTTGATNASGLLASAANPGVFEITLTSFWTVSLKHAATLNITALGGNMAEDLVALSIPLQAMTPQYIDVLTLWQTVQPNNKHAHYFRLDVTFEVPYCGMFDVPILVVDEVVIGPYTPPPP